MPKKNGKKGAGEPSSRRPRENTNVREKFGRVAVRLGFVSEDQVKEALRYQRAQDDAGTPHKLMGLIMLELGMLSNAQLIEILKYFELQERRDA